MSKPLLRTRDPKIAALALLPRFGGRLVARSYSPGAPDEWRIEGVAQDFLDRVMDDPVLHEIRAFIGALELVHGIISGRSRIEP